MITTKDIGKNNKQRSEEYEKNMDPDPKSRLAMEEFSGATTISVFQEFYIGLLFSNLSSLVKNQADEEIQSTYKRTNQYRYQANRSFIIGHLKSLFPKYCAAYWNCPQLTIYIRKPFGVNLRSYRNDHFHGRKIKRLDERILGIKKYLFNLLHFKK